MDPGSGEEIVGFIFNSTKLLPGGSKVGEAKCVTEKDRVKQQKKLMMLHNKAFEKMRKESDYAMYGKDKPGKPGKLPSSLYLNMENVIATQKRLKRLDGNLMQVGDCPIRVKADELRKKNWPDKEVEDLVKQAEQVLRQIKPKSIADVFQLQISKKKSQPQKKATTEERVDGKEGVEEDEAVAQDQQKFSPGSGAYLMQLLQFLNIKPTLIGEYFRADSTLNQACKSLPSFLLELDDDTAKADEPTRRWAKSQMKSHNSSYGADKAACVTQLRDLTEVVQKKEDLRGKRMSWLEERKLNAKIDQEMEEKAGLALKAILELKDTARTWRRTLNRRLLQCQTQDKTSLRTFNIGLDWNDALGILSEEMDLKVGGKFRMREDKISGFTMDFYQRVYDLFAMHRNLRSEFVPMDEILEATGTPRALKGRCVTAMKSHLPVSLLRSGPKFVLIDNLRLLTDSTLIIKISTLEAMVPEKKYVIQQKLERPKSKKKPCKSHRRPKTQFHSKHPATFEAAREIIMTDGVLADNRRRTELGLSRLSISSVLKRMKEILPAGTVIPTYNTVKRCVHFFRQFSQIKSSR